MSSSASPIKSLPASSRQIEDEMARRARTSFADFVLFTRPHYVMNWHHRTICAELEKVISGETPRLIIQAPPRHGKSELSSRCIPAYIFGRNPDATVITGSYSADLASMMNRDVQRIMDSDRYRKVFPGSRLNSSNIRTVSGQWIRNSDMFEIVERRGSYRCAGVGGGVTGMGANFCFASDTLISTASGDRPIRDIVVGDSVWSYNHEERAAEQKRVEAVSVRRVSEVVQVTTTRGRMVICTPEHPFWTQGRSYQEAKVLRTGEELVGVPEAKKVRSAAALLSLFEGVHQAALRIRKMAAQGHGRLVLLKGMFRGASWHEKQKTVLRVRPVSGHEAFKVLLKDVPAKSSEYATEAVPGVLYGISSEEPPDAVLLKNVCGSFPLQGDAKSKKSKLEARQWERWLPRCFRQNTRGNLGAGWSCVRHLLRHRTNIGTPHQPRAIEQRPPKPNCTLQTMPCIAPQVCRDSVSSVGPIGRAEIDVYDIRVEGNHNFFAAGVLVHNCIIDDPIKNLEEAHSITYREKVWGWYLSTLYTRLEGAVQGVLLILTRWHEDDLAGRLIAQAKSEPDADQWKVINLAAVKEGPPTDLDPRKEGEPLWPERFPASRLRSIRATQTPLIWSALYQGRPSPTEGNIFKRQWWRFWYPRGAEAPPREIVQVEENGDTKFIECVQRELPAGLMLHTQSWDMAFKDTKASDFVAGQVWAECGSESFLLDQIWGRLDFIATLAAVRALSDKWPQALAKLVEDKANGAAVISTLKREVAGMIPVEPAGGKEARAMAASPAVFAGNVWLPHPALFPWVREFIEEHATFPNATHDDQVDAETQYLNHRYGTSPCAHDGYLSASKRSGATTNNYRTMGGGFRSRPGGVL